MPALRRLALVVLGLTALAARAASLQTPAQIRDAAHAFASAQAARLGPRVEVEIGRVDPRLRLARCGQPLQVFASAGEIRAGGNTLGVRCEGPRWTVYLTAAVRVFRPVLILERAVARGDLVGAQDVRLVEREIGRLHGRFLQHRARVVGRRARRDLPAGTVLSHALLETPALVHRGQRVVVLARRGALEVRSHGRALADAAGGERVAVRNLRSKRVVEGRVLADGSVEVTM